MVNQTRKQPKQSQPGIGDIVIQHQETEGSPYFVGVDTSLSKLRMFFGRRQELLEIFSYLKNGESVLVVGERRIGKTFLLYMVGNFARRYEDLYKQLCDQQTGT